MFKKRESIESIKARRKREYDKEMEKKEQKDPGLIAFTKFRSAFVSFDTENIELAGFKFVNDEIKTNALGLHYPEDQLLLDTRSKSGLYALVHADKPAWVKPNKTKKEGLEVEALTLLNRYRDLKIFVMEASKMYYQHVLSSFDEESHLEAYEKEKHFFSVDKELGLYWYILFSLLGDTKVDEVLSKISHFNWDMIDGAQEYFKREEYLKIKKYEDKVLYLTRFKTSGSLEILDGFNDNSDEAVEIKLEKQKPVIDQKITELMKGYRVSQVCAVDKTTFIIIAKPLAGSAERLGKSLIISTTIHLDFTIGLKYEYGTFGKFHADGGYPHGKKRGITSDTGGIISFFSYDPNEPNGSERHKNTYDSVSTLKLIGDHFYVVSANRSVYKRTGVGQWSHVSKQPSEHSVANPVGLINAIDGFSEKDIYMAGAKGDLWHFKEDDWKQLKSSINWTISHLICAEDGRVYLAGHKGQLLVGLNNDWHEVITESQSAEFGVSQLQSMVWFKQKLYATNGYDVYYFDQNQWVKADFIKNNGNINSLHANEEVMLIGASQLVTVFDGQNEEILYQSPNWPKAHI